ncbi:hypothetical protein HNR23_000124 [Nocardiopsis mwathae]|uniref:Uncharacterized protein n=1 Tax=Nocardiopsis mwathae TaxID=1472723 RepID=A0A7W9YDC1_9ACTN|nr:hypothetical protein [Nocardiopsis mwathae]MBB6170064.1 hypothetical protein [Nocardiopsis mwathae]
MTPEIARTELAKFFVIADLASESPEMFSAYIDAEWHRMLGTKEYRALYRDAVGHSVGHVSAPGSGTPSWLGLYHERYGTLPCVWFADKNGAVDRELYGRYLRNRGGRLHSDDAPAEVPLIVTWDCQPTTNDGDDFQTASPPETEGSGHLT